MCFKNGKKRIFRRIAAVFLLLLLISAMFIRWLNKKLDVIVSDIVEEELKNRITKIINESIYESMSLGDYKNIMTLSESGEGKVRSLLIDSVKVNMLRADVSRRISEKLDELSKYDVYVDISNVFVLSYTGRGTCCFFNRYIFSIAVCVWIYRYVLGFCCLADGAGVCLYSLRCTCGLESYFSFIKAVFRKGKL